MIHLTKYTIGNMYNQSQVAQLAEEMAVDFKAQPKFKVGDKVNFSNLVAEFEFTLSKEGYFTLCRIEKLLKSKVGSTIVVGCHFANAFAQGDIGTLTRNEGPSGWWAEFKTGEWNVGSGIDFFVIS